MLSNTKTLNYTSKSWSLKKNNLVTTSCLLKWCVRNTELLTKIKNNQGWAGPHLRFTMGLPFRVNISQIKLRYMWLISDVYIWLISNVYMVGYRKERQKLSIWSQTPRAGPSFAGRFSRYFSWAIPHVTTLVTFFSISFNFLNRGPAHDWNIN